MEVLGKLIVFFAVPMILIGIGVFFRKHSLKMQKFISFPLITSCLTILFLECSIAVGIILDELFKIKGGIIPIFLVLLIISFCGLILGILISNKLLVVKFKLIPLNTIGMFLTIFIGFSITSGWILAVEAGFINGDIQKLFHSFGFFIFQSLGCLGGFLGAILWERKLVEKNQ